MHWKHQECIRWRRPVIYPVVPTRIRRQTHEMNRPVRAQVSFITGFACKTYLQVYQTLITALWVCFLTSLHSYRIPNTAEITSIPVIHYYFIPNDGPRTSALEFCGADDGKHDANISHPCHNLHGTSLLFETALEDEVLVGRLCTDHRMGKKSTLLSMETLLFRGRYWS